ncbi:MAG: isocitrate lyase/phosphoenolpyruvate mutase family protein [Planctomycetes bacterium]|nr:isocitrate lyase/phosphoenolpyruvate mutase family protein [Planctomycetota bacterium]
MSETSPGKKLRQAITQGTIQVPGAPNALMGRLIERAGFPAAYLSGAALSAGVMAMPDIGRFSLDELQQQTRYLTRTVDIPVIVDADTGFEHKAGLTETIVALDAARAAAVQLEDQVESTKRCGHLSGKSLIATESMCAKLRTAALARRDCDLVLIARTDAYGVDGIDAAIERAGRYIEAGADWIFPEALETREDFAKFAKAIDAPLVANMTEFGKSPSLTLAELSELGYAAVLYPVTLLRLAMKTAEAALATIQEQGTQADLIGGMQTRQELYDLLDYRVEVPNSKSQIPNPKS